MSHKAQMNGGGESYNGIVPAKQGNEGRGGPKETVEGRPLIQENAEEPNSNRTAGQRADVRRPSVHHCQISICCAAATRA